MKTNYCGTWESVKTHTIPQWYDDAKFGVFIHWGIYSVPAFAPRTWELGAAPSDEDWFANNPYAEWYYNSLNIGRGPTYEHHIKTYGKDFKYEDFLPRWKAESWDPVRWADIFKAAGARYVVLVTKHHDGFCLFPSKYTRYNSTEAGPGRNITGELSAAVREKGMRMGLYYSGILDWTFAHDPILRGSENFTKACPTYEYADYAYNQCVELIDTYKPSILWNDIGWPAAGAHNLPYLLAHYFNTVEEGVVDDRWSGLYHDFTTKEYHYGESNRAEKWEMCRGLGLSFGYNAEEGDDKIISEAGAVSLLVSTVANNGNLLLNTGPRADGTIPLEQEKRLLALGKWLAVNGEAIYSSRCSKRESVIGKAVEREGGSTGDFPGIDLHFTRKGADLYVMLDKLPPWPFSVTLPNVRKNGVPLDAEAGLSCEAGKDGLVIRAKARPEAQTALVIKVGGGEES